MTNMQHGGVAAIRKPDAGRRQDERVLHPRRR